MPNRVAIVWRVSATLALAGCGATATSIEGSGTAVELVMYRPTPIPGTAIVATLHDVRPEQPREELGQGGGFVEREPAEALVEVTSGAVHDAARWSDGHVTWNGTELEVEIARDGHVTVRAAGR